MPPTAARSSLGPALLCVCAFALLALASYGFALYDFLVALARPGIEPFVADRDFANYWMAGRLTVAGDALTLFDHGAYLSRLEAALGASHQVRSWSYPPHTLLLLWPLGLLSYKAAFAAFFAVGGALFGAAAVVFRRALAPTSDGKIVAIAVLGFALLTLVAAQNGFYSGAALLLALAWMRSRPALAGLALACLTVKPQLGVLVPVLLLLDRNWRAIAWSALFTAALVAASALAFGLESWTAYVADTVPYQRSVMTEWYGSFLSMMPTVFGSLRSLDVAVGPAALAQAVVAVAALVFVAARLRREEEPLVRAFLVVCATFLVTPYAFNYDMGALAVCAAALAATPRMLARPRAAVVLAVAASLAPTVYNLGRAHLPITPLLLAAALAAVAPLGRVSSRALGAETQSSAPRRS
jgi:hypothetical protein